MTVEVEDIAETMDEVAEMADELNGYVVSSYKHEYERGVSGYIAIRVPFEKFDEAFERLRQLATAVPYETTKAKDVTEEYVDLEAQLGNLLATEAQYLALLDKAENVEEMLKVQKELSKVRGEIEQIEGRMKYLEQTSFGNLAQKTPKGEELRVSGHLLRSLNPAVASFYVYICLRCYGWRGEQNDERWCSLVMPAWVRFRDYLKLRADAHMGLCKPVWNTSTERLL
jgi:predicted  nucleic acid-binding Zn-ribbon protein